MEWISWEFRLSSTSATNGDQLIPFCEKKKITIKAFTSYYQLYSWFENIANGEKRTLKHTQPTTKWFIERIVC